jgi:hypothetical protein
MPNRQCLLGLLGQSHPSMTILTQFIRPNTAKEQLDEMKGYGTYRRLDRPEYGSMTWADSIRRSAMETLRRNSVSIGHRY